jgi:hypothetical protein
MEVVGNSTLGGYWLTRIPGMKHDNEEPNDGFR